MDDLFQRLNGSLSNDNQILSDLDKMIRIKYLKEKNKNKTCVYGIFDFVPEKNIKDLIKLIKKRLGCSGIINEEVTSRGKKTKVLIFSGNFVEEIKNIILEKKITDKSHIKV